MSPQWRIVVALWATTWATFALCGVVGFLTDPLPMSWALVGGLLLGTAVISAGFAGLVVGLLGLWRWALGDQEQ